MSNQKSNILLPVLGGVAVIAGGVGAYIFYTQTIKTGVATVVESAKLVPQQVLFAASISGDSNAWAQLEQFQTPEVKKYLDAEIQKLEKEAFGSSDINFNADIKPWAGNIMVALLPPSPAAASRTSKMVPVSTTILAQAAVRDTPNVLVVVQVKDAAAADQFFTKVKGQAQVTEKDYKGVKVSEVTRTGGSPTSVAMLGSYAVFSPQAKSIEQAIDTFQGAPSLATVISPANLELKNPLVQFFIPDFAGSVEKLVALNPDASPISPQTLTQIKSVKSITMGLGVDREGLRLKGVTELEPNSITVEYKTAPGKVIAQFPAETMALITGMDIKTRWEQFVKEAAADPELKSQLDEVRSGLKNSPLALDLDKDIFSWMDGEYALGAIASSDGLLAQTGVGPAFIFQTSNRAAAEATLKKIDDFARTSGLAVATRDVEGVAVTEWTTPQAPGFAIGHGWFKPDTLFLSVGSLIPMIVKPSNSLSNSPTFKSVTGSLSTSNIGYFYLDMEKSWNWFSTRFISPSDLAALTPEVKALINTVRGIGVTASLPSKTTSKFELLLALKPKP